ncbi:MAG: hypothetical protein ISR58_08890 [Anaerolineales bacterium]|nr:hypothetical protein [Chloroflexota bacterium]MBL6981294.1 hypothetical protein [Anaerolineales bacterium]
MLNFAGAATSLYFYTFLPFFHQIGEDDKVYIIFEIPHVHIKLQSF